MKRQKEKFVFVPRKRRKKEHPLQQKRKKSLVSLYKEKEKKECHEDQIEIERALLDAVSKKMPLTSLRERRNGDGIKKTGFVSLGWKPSKYSLSLDEQYLQMVRKSFDIEVEGNDIPKLIDSFHAMRLSNGILKALKDQKIVYPTAIQMQALPVLLSGRDLLGIAYTGSGKTLTFSIPMIMHSLLEELKMPLIDQEGPIGLIVCPSRELARQIGMVIENICKYLVQEDKFPALNVAVCVGGVPVREFTSKVQGGIHMVVATPGRLLHMLQNQNLTLKYCKYICLDEADRLIDLGFEENIRDIFNFLECPERQTVLFSATMPAKIRMFALSALSNHITIHVGRAGAVSRDITQHVEYVKSEDKLSELLKTLCKSPPPVLIFARHKHLVDEIHEFLLLSGIDVVSLHGDMSEKERNEAIQSFKSGEKDVLIGTDVASKGLDIQGINHVINFDLPQDIEDYVHRVGRTGRGGSKGLATSFVNEECSYHFLMDLKHLIIEAQHPLPDVLKDFGDDSQVTIGGIKGCLYCSGLGHRILQCEKLARDIIKEEKQIMGKKGG